MDRGVERGLEWTAGADVRPILVLEAVIRAVSYAEEESGPLRAVERQAAVQGALEGSLGYRVRGTGGGLGSVEYLDPDGVVRAVAPCSGREADLWQLLVRFGVEVVSRIAILEGRGGSVSGGVRVIKSAEPKEDYL